MTTQGNYLVPNPITVTVTTAGTAVQVSNSERIVRGFYVKARIANAGAAYLGDVDVAAGDGLEVPETEYLYISGPTNLELWYVDAATNGDIVDILPVE